MLCLLFCHKYKNMTKKNLQKFIALIIAMCICTISFAQLKTIVGKVINKAGQGVSGASIKIKGTNDGTATNETGNFSISVNGNSTLIVTSVGFLPEEKLIGVEENIIIELKDDESKLTDVVVTAYGIKKETKKLGYSVQEIKGADLIKARDANAINSLSGKIAGLSVGANPEMLGRPELVLRGSKDLLFVVDGVPVNTDTWNVSPDDIETYTILKGVNASALYGYRGSNGAIIITTKRGSKDKKGWQIDFNTSTVFEKNPRRNQVS